MADEKLNDICDICFVLVPNDLFKFFPICFVPSDVKLNDICFVLVPKQIKNKQDLVLFGTKATLVVTTHLHCHSKVKLGCDNILFIGNIGIKKIKFQFFEATNVPLHCTSSTMYCT